MTGMDNLSNELNKLKIDKSRRFEPRRTGNRGLSSCFFSCRGLLAVVMMRGSNAGVSVETIHPGGKLFSVGGPRCHRVCGGSPQGSGRFENRGRVAWIGVEKGDRVKRDQVVVRIEDREYRAQYQQAQSAYDSAEARLQKWARLASGRS
jgi:hypothetical protein